MIRKGLATLGLGLYAGAVYAQATQPSGPSWEIVAVGSVGLLVTIVLTGITTWTAAMSRRVKDVEIGLAELNNFIRDQYHNRASVDDLIDAVRRDISEIKGMVREQGLAVNKQSESLAALQVRLDVAGVPHSHSR